MTATASRLASAADYRIGFESLEREVRIDSLAVHGRFPDWLDGTLLRNGPARFEVGATSYRHWFDGLAMVHRFAIAGGRVGYANRFLRSPAFVQAQRTGRIARAEFATNPQPTLLERLISSFGRGSSDNANVNIVPFGGDYLAQTETPAAILFDGESLETLGVRGPTDDLRGQLTTAHGLHDAARGATFNVVVEIARHPRYSIVRTADGSLQRTEIASIAVAEPSYMHAIAATERYVVVIEYPLVVRPIDLLVRRRPFIDNYRWQPQRATRFHLIAKDGGALVAAFEGPAFFAFHPINAYDDGDTVVLDVSAYDDAAIVGDLRLDRLRRVGGAPPARARVQRYRLIPGVSTVRPETLHAMFGELPRVAPSTAGKRYRYAYAVDSSADAAVPFARIVRCDMDGGATMVWSSAAASPGEPVFVPRPGATDEDDGVVLAVVLDARARSSYLVVLDGRTLAELGRAVVPHPIPFGFHGLFAQNASE